MSLLVVIFFIIENVADCIQQEKESNEFNHHNWNETIRELHEDYLESKKQKMNFSGFGSNEMQTQFIFYNLYKIIGNEEKALIHVALAFQLYKEYFILSMGEHCLEGI